MKALFSVCIFLLFICARSFGQENYRGGLVYGPKAAFNIGGPEGWVLDNHAGRDQGLPCSEWQPSPRMMSGHCFLSIQRRIQKRRWNPAGLERIDLIFHQRDQWRYHDGQPVPQQRRQLKTKRLPAASASKQTRLGLPARH
jgi:hypothetical protein